MTVTTKIDRTAFESEECRALASKLNIPPLLLAILQSRDCTTEKEMSEFLTPDTAKLLSPFEMKDMEKAAKRILSAVRTKEKVLIYGDYDVDGITSVALLYHFLESMGLTAECYIPDRLTEGYGLGKSAIDGFAEKKISLMITVDTGSTSAKEVAYAQKLGISTVVTDHHECCGELPVCEAAVNPMRKDCTYSFKGLAGVGVVFKLVCAMTSLSSGCTEEEAAKKCLDLYGDLAALGTVADVMPLTGENRIIVKKGLEVIERSSHPGIQALLSSALNSKGGRRECTATTVGFGLAPRINAAGRMGNAGEALALMLTDDTNEGKELANRLCELNLARQTEENRIFEEASEMMKKISSDTGVAVLAKEGWHQGVIGIVSSRLTEKYKKPTILITIDGETAKGSGRSRKDVNLADLLSMSAQYLEKFGGHELAAGLSLKTENIENFSDAVNKAYGTLCRTEEEDGSITVDAELYSEDLTLPFAASLALLEPCGSGNDQPVFVMKNAKVVTVQALSEGKHTKLYLEKDGIGHTALCFGKKSILFRASEGEEVDVVFNLSVNDFGGRKSVQMIVKDLALSEKAEEVRAQARKAVSSPESALTCDLPSRRDYASVYLQLKNAEERKEKRISAGSLMTNCKGLSFARLLAVMKAFEEKKLVSVRYENGDVFDFSLLPQSEKVDIEDAPTIRKLKEAAMRT